MNPLSETKREQDALFDELCIGCGFGAANIQGLKAFMHTRDLAIENAVRAELVEKVKLMKEEWFVTNPRHYFVEKDDVLALLTTSPSR